MNEDRKDIVYAVRRQLVSFSYAIFNTCYNYEADHD